MFPHGSLQSEIDRWVSPHGSLQSEIDRWVSPHGSLQSEIACEEMQKGRCGGVIGCERKRGGLEGVGTEAVVGALGEDVSELAAADTLDISDEAVVIGGGHGLTADARGAIRVTCVPLDGGSAVGLVSLAAIDHAVAIEIAGCVIEVPALNRIEAIAAFSAKTGGVIIDARADVSDITASIAIDIGAVSAAHLSGVRGRTQGTAGDFDKAATFRTEDRGLSCVAAEVSIAIRLGGAGGRGILIDLDGVGAAILGRPLPIGTQDRFSLGGALSAGLSPTAIDTACACCKARCIDRSRRL